MTKLHENSLLPIGKITVEVDPLTGLSIPYVYQRVAKGKGNIPLQGPHDLQLRRYVLPAPTVTAKQKQKRTKFRQAVAAWQRLSLTEKAAWNRKAEMLTLSGYNLFIREYLNRVVITNPGTGKGKPGGKDVGA
jgi:hypothetical protein